MRYRDYAVWQRRRVSGPLLERGLAHWTGRLVGARPLALPVDRSGQNPLGAARRLRHPVPHLAATSARLDATPFMVLFAAWATLLARLTGETNVTLGTPVANRARGETEGFVGFFVNALALRLDLSGKRSFAEAVAHARMVCLDAFANQDMPFEQYVQALRPARGAGGATLFGQVFALLPSAGTRRSSPVSWLNRWPTGRSRRGSSWNCTRGSQTARWSCWLPTTLPVFSSSRGCLAGTLCSAAGRVAG